MGRNGIFSWNDRVHDGTILWKPQLQSELSLLLGTPFRLPVSKLPVRALLESKHDDNTVVVLYQGAHLPLMGPIVWRAPLHAPIVHLLSQGTLKSNMIDLRPKMGSIGILGLIRAD